MEGFDWFISESLSLSDELLLEPDKLESLDKLVFDFLERGRVWGSGVGLFERIGDIDCNVGIDNKAELCCEIAGDGEFDLLTVKEGAVFSVVLVGAFFPVSAFILLFGGLLLTFLFSPTLSEPELAFDDFVGSV